MIKKFIFSTYQTFWFFIEIFKGNGYLRLHFVETDWPHSNSRRRILIIGILQLCESKVFIKIGDKMYGLNHCPQREFFENLDQGIHVKDTSYYSLVTQLYGDVDFDQWETDRLKLWKEFQADLWNPIPVAIRISKGIYVVEDGAHRLALRSLRGNKSHPIGVSLWHFG